MASGELVRSDVREEDLPFGAALTSSGRVSAAHEFGTANPEHLPFATQDLVALDDALTQAIRQTKIRFNVYIGDLGVDPAAGTPSWRAGSTESCAS